MSNVKDTVDAVKGIVEAVPVYEDMLQPATQELSKGFLTLARTVNLALAPLSGLVWGYEKISEYLDSSISDKLKSAQPENIITPDASVAGPAIEALRFSAHNENIREMFSSLLATAMDKTTAHNAHPSFVEIIKQLNTDEAKILSMIDGKSPIPLVKTRLYNKTGEDNRFSEPLRNFSLISYSAECTHPNLGPSYLENIERLGLVNLSYEIYNTNPGAYDKISEHPTIKYWENEAERHNMRFELNRGAMTQTSFGEMFYKTCVSK